MAFHLIGTLDPASWNRVKRDGWKRFGQGRCDKHRLALKQVQRIMERRSRMQRTLLAIAFVAGLAVLSLPAQAQTGSGTERIYCPIPEDGVWVNPDAAPKEISRVEVESRCENEQVFVRARAFTSCIPRDCKWGWTKGELRSDGAVRVLLIGFLSSKDMTLKAFGDLLDVRVVNILNDLSEPNETKVYNLRRK
jgi:hypothetical protein